MTAYQWRVIATIAIYLSLNLGLNFFNKYAFTPKPDGLGFSFPIFQSACDSVITLTLLSALMQCKPELNTISPYQFWRYKLRLLLVAVLSQGTVISNNASLVLIGLSLNQMIKCVTPLPTVLFAFVIEKKTPSRGVLGTLLVLVTGAVLAVPFGDPSFSALGIMLALSAVLMAAFRATLTALLMRDADNNGLTPVALVWYTAAVSVFVLPLLWSLSEERPAVLAFFAAEPGMAVSIVFTISLAAAAYNVLVFEVTRITSSLSFTVINCVKLVMLINLAAIFVDHVTSVLVWCGTGLFYLGLFAYTYLKFKEDAAAASERAAGAAEQEKLAGEKRPLTEGADSGDRTPTQQCNIA